MIGSEGFIVNYHGDSSVGDFPQTWEIRGEFEFEDEGDMASFKEKISEAFEYACGEATEVITFEEIEKLKQEDKDIFV